MMVCIGGVTDLCLVRPARACGECVRGGPLRGGRGGLKPVAVFEASGRRASDLGGWLERLAVGRRSTIGQRTHASRQAERKTTDRKHTHLAREN